ncbi:hypothetical protein YC2023_109869 [Brassica napus]
MQFRIYMSREARPLSTFLESNNKFKNMLGSNEGIKEAKQVVVHMRYIIDIEMNLCNGISPLLFTPSIEPELKSKQIIGGSNLKLVYIHQISKQIDYEEGTNNWSIDCGDVDRENCYDREQTVKTKSWRRRASCYPSRASDGLSNRAILRYSDQDPYPAIILLSLSGFEVFGYPGLLIKLTDLDIRTKKSRYPDPNPALTDPTFYYPDPDLAPSDIRIFGSDPDHISYQIRISDKSHRPSFDVLVGLNPLG